MSLWKRLQRLEASKARAGSEERAVSSMFPDWLEKISAHPQGLAFWNEYTEAYAQGCREFCEIKSAAMPDGDASSEEKMEINVIRRLNTDRRLREIMLRLGEIYTGTTANYPPLPERGSAAGL